MTKSGRGVIQIFKAFDLTGTALWAAQLARCDAETVARYVAVRVAGGDPLEKTWSTRKLTFRRTTPAPDSAFQAEWPSCLPYSRRVRSMTCLLDS
jgi:hypothetical protein